MFGPAKSASIVGLDLEAGSAAAAELETNGSSSVSTTAISSLAPGVIEEGEVVDTEALAADLKRMFSEHKLSKQVRLGVANQRVLARVLTLPLIEDPEELDTAVRFQAQEELPMPLDEAVLDYQVISRDKDEEGNRRMDVVAVAARRDMLTSLTGALRSAGLRPVGIDLSAFAMIRALSDTAADSDEETALYCHFGDVTNLAVARNGACLFTRISPFGIEGIARKLAERAQMPIDEARRRLIVVGLEAKPGEVMRESRESSEPSEPGKSQMAEGGSDDSGPGESSERSGAPGGSDTAREALNDGAAKLAAELRLSLEFYAAQEGAPAVERLVVCGPGSTIPGLSDYLEDALDYPVDEERPRALSALDDHDAARLTVSYGLAVEGDAA
jgi:type IV pilus assembly protein PilM